MFCGQCGFNNPDGSRFCIKCGADLNQFMAPGAGQARPAAPAQRPVQQPMQQSAQQQMRPQVQRPAQQPRMQQPAQPQMPQQMQAPMQRPVQQPRPAHQRNRPSSIPDAGPAVRPGSNHQQPPVQQQVANPRMPVQNAGGVVIPRGPVQAPDRPSAGVTVLDDLMNAPAHPASSELPRIAVDAPRSATAPRVTLVRERGSRYNITDFPATVGKGSAANVRIEGNTAISRVHLLIRYTGQCFAVEDKNSTNGTFINGNRLEPGELVKLNNGDRLGMGNETFTVEIR